MIGPGLVTMPRESKEYVPVSLTVDGEATTDFDVTVVADGTRPTAGWVPVSVVGGEAMVLINGPALGRGRLAVYSRVEGNPEVPVTLCGYVELT